MWFYCWLDGHITSNVKGEIINHEHSGFMNRWFGAKVTYRRVKTLATYWKNYVIPTKQQFYTSWYVLSFHIVAVSFGVIIVFLSSGSWHHNFHTTYSDKTVQVHNIRTLIVTCLIGVCFKEMLVSFPWRWRDNNAETCRSYVQT